MKKVNKIQPAKKEWRPGKKYITGDKEEYNSKGHHILTVRLRNTIRKKLQHLDMKFKHRSKNPKT